MAHSPVRRPRRRRRLPLFTLLAALGLLLAAIAFELLLRIADPLQYALAAEQRAFMAAICSDEVPAGRSRLNAPHLRPGATAEFLGHTYRINSAGFRGPDVAKTKPAGVFRIAVVGDSVPFGWGVAESDCFPRRLETELNRRTAPFGHERVQVLNLSGPGRTLGDYVVVLREEALRYDPDLIIVPFIFNDVPLEEAIADDQRPPPPLQVPATLDWSWAARYLTALLNRARATGPRADYWVGIRTTPLASELCCTGFRLLQQTAGEVPLVILDTVGDRPGEGIETIADCTREMGLDRIEAYLDRDRFHTHWGVRPPLDMHPNAAAHAVYTERLLDWLRDSGMLK